jgi:heat shock protein HslJ
VSLLILLAFLLVGAGCGGDDQGEGSVSITGVWEWEGSAYSNDTESVPDDPSKYTADFVDDGTLSIVADCNRSSGTWTSEPSPDGTSGSLTIELGPTTLVACEPGSLSDVFLRDLGAAGAYLLGGGKLRIDIRADVGTMTFAPA